jgi:hypothetical protein
VTLYKPTTERSHATLLALYRHNNSISVVIEPAHSLIHARLRASIDGLDQNEFTEAHELDRKWKVAKETIGRQINGA